MATAEQTLLTAEEFGARPNVGPPEELVRGRIVMSPPPNRRHGFTCVEVAFHLRLFLEGHRFGRVYGNDSGIVIERNPDTVRGADVAYYSYAKLPEGSRSTGYGPEIPELVFEVKSPSDRWSDISRKVSEYLNAGVLFVTVLDPDDEIAVVHGAESAPRTLGRNDELAYPQILPGFSVVVGRLFE
ncbi:MAG: Uma2 family endonuclease [Paludisphaera borealis]|uniref:Uma2 family endonuclease n=1 Tax=Paludisphaera borealis TaxID=1387353 RepID=UPI00284FC31D|nr:Uma2 family endonuclease [Paludisphaera borealis]MDR3622117.1 Uma2 family endonuclease [Paludisphaera borealis]